MFAEVWFGLSIAHWLVVVSALISLSGAVAYIRDMYMGRSKPNLVTWGLWAFAPLIATGAALSADADLWATVRIFMSGFGPLLIFIAAFLVPQSYWKLTSFDYACGALSLIALFAWLGADSPVLAILLAAIADLLAAFPTMIKAWRHPETETLYTYFVGLFTASIVIPAIPVWNIENAAFQIYLLITNIILFVIVLRGHIPTYVDQRAMDKKIVPKALAYVVQDGKLLVFRHVDYSFEEVGLQVPGGTIEPGETPEAAVMRELKEETAYDCFEIIKKLGVTTYDITPYRYEIQKRHIFLVHPTAELPERWQSQEEHEGTRTPTKFENFWLPIAKGQILQSGQGALIWMVAE